MTDRIKIVQIQKDRKQCIDTNGKIYNISDIEGHQDKFNVYVRRGIGPDKIKGIAWKSREAHQNKLRTYKLDIITEDKSSANEIIKAIKKIAEDVKNEKIGIEDIDEELVSNNLYTKGMPDPDLLIRTSGELRLSNFLPWQLVYSEFLFIDKNWPDFTEQDLDDAILEYEKRTRKFGAN